MDNVKFRRAKSEDVQILADWRMHFLQEFYRLSADEEYAELAGDVRRYFSKALCTGEFIAWLAECHGECVGMGGMVLWQMPPKPRIKRGRLGYILNMYTVPKARNKGIGTHLLNKLIQEAEALGITYLHLHPSEEGMSIYRRAGFKDHPQIELELIL